MKHIKKYINMKHINTYIIEKLKISKSRLTNGPDYTLFPKDKYELVNMIKNEIEKNGNECSLNHIDISKITDLTYLFAAPYLYNKYKYNLHEFNGDISEWDVSKVKDMGSMFKMSRFNQDISNWNVSNVEEMWDMFLDSNFNQDISDWEINPHCDTVNMFWNCPIEDEYRPFKNGKRI